MAFACDEKLENYGKYFAMNPTGHVTVVTENLH